MHLRVTLGVSNMNELLILPLSAVASAYLKNHYMNNKGHLSTRKAKKLGLIKFEPELSFFTRFLVGYLN
jgi:hypothetical protein